MHIYDLKFSDGKSCRSIVMEPTTEAEDCAGITRIFADGYLVSLERIVPPIPDKLLWRRDSRVWRLHRFELGRLAAGSFRVTWPDGSCEGDAEAVKQAVRDNWRYGC